MSDHSLHGNHDSEGDAHRYLQEMLVEFLRAVSASDKSGRPFRIDYAFWKAINALGHIDSDRRMTVSEAAFANAMGAASAMDDIDECAADRVATASAKVLAERIAGKGTQHRLAQQRLNDDLRSWAAEMDEFRRRAMRGIG
jgi:hypothetical protein